jgi:hypothetical protein
MCYKYTPKHTNPGRSPRPSPREDSAQHGLTTNFSAYFMMNEVRRSAAMANRNISCRPSLRIVLSRDIRGELTLICFRRCWSPDQQPSQLKNTKAPHF